MAHIADDSVHTGFSKSEASAKNEDPSRLPAEHVSAAKTGNYVEYPKAIPLSPEHEVLKRAIIRQIRAETNFYRKVQRLTKNKRFFHGGKTPHQPRKSKAAHEESKSAAALTESERAAQLLQAADTSKNLVDNFLPFFIVGFTRSSKQQCRLSEYLKEFHGLHLVHAYAHDNLFIFSQRKYVSLRANVNGIREPSASSDTMSTDVSPRDRPHSEQSNGLNSMANDKSDSSPPVTTKEERTEALFETLSRFYENQHAHRPLMNSFMAVCDQISDTLGEITSSSELRKAKSIRVQAYPKTLIPHLLEHLPEDVVLDPRTFDHLLFVYKLSNRYVWGVQPRRCHFSTLPALRALTESPLPTISRAQYKMSELCETIPIILDPKKSMSILDIGASPGGWTAYLAPRVPSGRVLCLDPGELHESVISLPNVTHVQKVAEDATSEIAEFTKDQKFSMCVCDINAHTEFSMQLLCSLAPFLDSGCTMILTVKLMRKSSLWLEKTVVRCVELLLSSGLFDSSVPIQYRWLFANSNLERTLVFQRK